MKVGKSHQSCRSGSPSKRFTPKHPSGNPETNKLYSKESKKLRYQRWEDLQYLENVEG